MTSFSVTSIKKAISEFQEDSAQFTTQQKSDPLFPSGWASEVFGTREGCYRKAVTVYHPNVLSLLLDSA
jgi:hypothetical protein